MSNDAEKSDSDSEPQGEPIDAEFAEVKSSGRGGAAGWLAAVLVSALLGGGLGAGAAFWLDQRAGPAESAVSQADMTGLSDQIASLEETLSQTRTRLDQLETRIKARASAETVSALEDQLETLEAAVESLDAPTQTDRPQEAAPDFDPAPLRNRLSALEDEFEAFGDRLAAAETRASVPPQTTDPRAGEALTLAERSLEAAEAAADRAEAMATRLEALESALESRDQSAQTVFHYLNLRQSVLSGAPFELALAEMRARFDSSAFALLAPLAETGVATPFKLAQEFPGAAIRAAEDEGQGLAGQARSALSSLGSLRRAGDEAAPAEDPVLLIQRALAEGDLPRAIERAEDLPSAQRAAAADWLAAARERRQAEQALDALQDDLMEALP